MNYCTIYNIFCENANTQGYCKITTACPVASGMKSVLVNGTDVIAGPRQYVYLDNTGRTVVTDEIAVNNKPVIAENTDVLEKQASSNSENCSKDLLVAVLKALFGPQLKGKYIVEFKGSVTVDADDKKDALDKAKILIKEDPDKVVLIATKVEDLIK